MQIDYSLLLDKYLERCPPALKQSAAIRKFINKVNKKLLETKQQTDTKTQMCDAIDEIIGSNRRDKEKLVEFIAGFCKYIEQTERIKLEPRVLSAEVIDDPTERRLRMACFLHEPRTTEDIVAHFFQSDRTVRKDLAALEEGISFMGQHIQISKIREKRKVRYKSTLHPIFLPLNLTEVYALTTGLLTLIPRDNPLYDIYKYLAECIYGQLSIYGRKIIHNAADRADLYFPPVDTSKHASYRDERDLIQKREGALMYMLKRFEECDVSYVKDGEVVAVRGRLRFNITDGAIDVLTGEDTITLSATKIIQINPVKYN